MLTDRKISIIVVCYNDGGSVREMYRRVTAIMAEITSNYEIVYVNENSPDGAEEILQELALQDKRLMLVNHTRNFGTQQAYTTGLTLCTGDAAILLDGDIQDPPELFPELVKKWLEGYQIVYGIRTRRKGSALRRVGYKLFYRIFKTVAEVPMPLDASEFGLMDRRAIDLINQLPEANRFIRGLRAWTGLKSIGIPYTRAERFAGETNLTFLDNVRYAKRMIFAFSSSPLEWISYLAGLVTVLSGVAIVAYVVIALLYQKPPTGFLTLLVSILFLGAVQLLCFSIIGEYIGRIYQEIKRRPHAIIRDIVNDHRHSTDI
ncbi:MAG: glycosyltransferase family 2 protein [Candidatus Magasanikbacteria bacterium]|nr:glycosyltransferase family 2 protein [Candidatus Magasanikbacteria bacterium]